MRLPGSCCRWQLARAAKMGCQTGEGAGHGRRGAGATDKRDRASRGPSVSGGVREGERRVRQCDSGALTCRPRQHSVGRLGLNGFETIQKFKRD
jgi:hypothetical protein